ncbi:MAG: leucine-rich repeat protein, partial [Romboutsia sp.]|nr:leucine-rich repeat protein [Romboutsia sp.]
VINLPTSKIEYINLEYKKFVDGKDLHNPNTRKELNDFFSKMGNKDKGLVIHVSSLLDHNKCLSISNDILPENATDITLIDRQDTLYIADKFLAGNTNIKNINLYCFEKLKAIGTLFLSNCHELVRVVLYNLTNLEVIGSNFLHCCILLNSVIFNRLEKLTTVDYGFFYNCLSLTYLDLSSLTELTSIGKFAFFYCVKLTKLDLSNSTKLESIDNYFFYSALSLTELNLSEITQLKSIGHSFLHNYSEKLTNIIISSDKIRNMILNNNDYDLTGIIKITDPSATNSPILFCHQAQSISTLQNIYDNDLSVNIPTIMTSSNIKNPRML